jgi:hypothetical protein
VLLKKTIQPPFLRTVTEGNSLQIDVNIDQTEYSSNLLDQITVLKDNHPIINKPEINKIKMNIKKK